MRTAEPRYWFRAKRYGLGWGLPLMWQGWVIFLGWMLAMPVGMLLLIPRGEPTRTVFVGAMIVLLIIVCYWKGDPAGRRWNNGGRGS